MAASGSAALAPRPEPAEALFEKLRPGPGRPPAEVADHQRARIHSAMIKLVAERGYPGVTLREISRLSGVSSRAFYKHYASKEECFLQTHELIVRRIIRRILAAQVQTPAWDDRLRITIRALLKQLARDPGATQLILVDAYTAGPAAREQAGRADHTFEARFKSCFDREPSDSEMPPILIKAIVAGILSIARSRVVTDRAAELPGLAEDLASWALALHANAPDLIEELDRQHPRGEFALRPLAPSSTADGVARSLAPAGDRALLLTAVAKLVAAEGYENLTARSIRDTAGSSPRKFDASFDGVEDCFLAAFEQKTREVLAEAATAQAAAHSWEEGIHAAVAAICDRVAADPVVAQVCFDKALSAGINGARCRAQISTEVARHLPRPGRAGEGKDFLAAEALVGAASGLIEQRVNLSKIVDGDLVPTLAYLALASLDRNAVRGREGEVEVKKQAV